MDGTLQEIYDGFAATYKENRSLFDMIEVFESFCVRLGTGRGRLLDLGCGAGESFARSFVERGWTVTGVGFSERWLCPNGKALFIYATRDYTGRDEFDGYKEFLGRKLFYSHKRPAELYWLLERTGLSIEAADYRDIGNEVLLWVTVNKPARAAIES